MIKIGLVSDTHGHVSPLERLVDRFDDEELEFLVHTGDVTRYKHLEPLFELGLDIHLAIGNMDTNPRSFQQTEASNRLTVHGTAGRLEVRDWSIGFTHGHRTDFIDQFRKENVSYVIHGHTHDRRDETIDGTRIINPGAIKPPNPSGAILNLSEDKLTFLDV
jgi:putative phosphoesterase